MIINPLRQKHVESFMRAMREVGIDPTAPFADKSLVGQVEAVGAITRSAARAEMLNGAQPDDLEPWQATQLAADVLNAVWKSLTAPKVSISPLPTTSTDTETVPQS